jgi:SAM-dependent methyltransferase
MTNSLTMSRDRGLDKLLGVPGDVGHPIPAGARVVDLGCGNGNRVRALLDRGYDACGCDIRFKEGPHRAELEAERRIRTIELEPYALPFESASCDFLFSEQVFEHVQNYDETLAEIARVLRPGGISLHVFPSRLRPIEGHVHVPFASVFRPDAWLLLWSRLGVRKPSQRGMDPHEVARQNKIYLDRHTNYLTRPAITAQVERHFAEYAFCERAALRYSRLAKLYPFLRFLPGLGPTLSTFQTRVLLLVCSAGATPVALKTARADTA